MKKSSIISAAAITGLLITTTVMSIYRSVEPVIAPTPVVITEEVYIPSETACGLELHYLGEFEYTGYCKCTICCDSYGSNRPVLDGKEVVYTSSGEYASKYTIAVDPKVIPIGSMVYLEGYGMRIAQDVGGAIKGNRVDIYCETHDEALTVGRQKGMKVWVLK